MQCATILCLILHRFAQHSIRRLLKWHHCKRIQDTTLPHYCQHRQVSLLQCPDFVVVLMSLHWWTGGAACLASVLLCTAVLHQHLLVVLIILQAEQRQLCTANVLQMQARDSWKHHTKHNYQYTVKE